MTRCLPGLAVLLPLSGCELDTCDTGCDSAEPAQDTSPTETYDGPTTIELAEYHCDDDGWWYVVETAGWSSGGELFIQQSAKHGGWSEQHPLPVFDADPYGYETMLYQELDQVDAANEQVDGASTLFACDEDTEEGLTWLVTVTDELGNEADCLAWGQDPSLFDKECS